MFVNSISASSVYPAWALVPLKSNVNVKLTNENGSEQVVAANVAKKVAVVDKMSEGRTAQSVSASRGATTMPWASLMQQIGLTPTGDYYKDYHATISRLDELIKYTSSPAKVREYLSLADKVSTVFVAPQTSSSLSNSVSGSEQIANLNRAMILNTKN